VATDRLAVDAAGAEKRKTLRMSLLAIASVFVFELVAGLATNSLALLTDSTHALLDAMVTLVLIVAVMMAVKPRDTDHTYGHGKIETVGGFIGGVALFVVAVFFIYEAMARIATPGGFVPVRPGTVGFVAIAYTLAVDAFRITILAKATRKTGASSVRADLYHSVADLASTGVALAGLWLVTTGFVQGDSIAAIILGGVLAFLSVRLVYQNATELTDVVSPALVARVRTAASDTYGVLECSDVKVRRVGRDAFVDVTVSLLNHLSYEEAHKTSDMVEQNIAMGIEESGLHAETGNITVHFEPTSKESTPEYIIEAAAARVRGVKGVHNILVSKVEGNDSIGVSLHVQVKKDAKLSEAHAIADAVEDSIKKFLKNADNITVHLEPYVPGIREVHPASGEIQDSVRDLIISRDDVERIGKITAYAGGDNTLKIDIGCVFKQGPGREMTIEQIHERVSEIEKQIRAMYPGSIVTIHAEPA
jgi:cation diffusion facilitator family transporter